MTHKSIPGNVTFDKQTGKFLARRKYTAASGENKTFSVRTTTEKEAWTKLRAFDQGLSRGFVKPYSSTELTYGKFLNQLFETVYKNKLKPSTFRLYSVFQNYHISKLEDVKLSKITIQLIEDCINNPQVVRVNSKGQKIKPLSPQSKRILRTFIAGTLNHAVRLGHIEKNPALLAVVHEKAPARKVKALSLDALKALLNSAGPMKTAYLLQATTGLRVGELLGLKWADLQGDVLAVKTQIQRVNGSLVEQSLKTDQSNRKVALIPEVVAELEKMERKGEYIFGTGTGKPLDPRNYNRSLEVDSAKAGLEKVTSHMLRHTFATIALEAGQELITISRALGHSSLAVTTIYAETSVEQVRGA